MADVNLAPENLSEGLWAFPSPIHGFGVHSWWLDSIPEPVLIDCPPVNQDTLSALKRLASGRPARILLTSRQAHGQVTELQQELGWPVLVQEQEAYLLPRIHNLDTFAEEHATPSGLRLLWTPGPTPGSCIIYAPMPWNVVFCGCLLIPMKFGQLASLQTQNTFHWTRYQNSLAKLRQWIPPNSFPRLASGVYYGSTDDRKIYPWEAWKQS